MTCTEFDRWLDDGGSAALEGAARAHARTCSRCAAALAADRELEASLSAFAVSAPPQFTARVLADLPRAPRRIVAWAPRPAVDWWVRAAADPAAALALVLAGLVAWRGDAIMQASAALVQGGLAASSTWLSRLPLGPAPSLQLGNQLSNRTVVLALTLAIAPALLWASWRLFRWAERACVPARAVAAR